mmetsp:Transcript_11319/g.31324  ORF Transcript_11319/g.31324 Transcript_11319/m.31324 type:complete len:210 (-) Transcript_11319:221-850(-)
MSVLRIETSRSGLLRRVILHHVIHGLASIEQTLLLHMLLDTGAVVHQLDRLQHHGQQIHHAVAHDLIQPSTKMRRRRLVLRECRLELGLVAFQLLGVRGVDFLALRLQPVMGGAQGRQLAFVVHPNSLQLRHLLDLRIYVAPHVIFPLDCELQHLLLKVVCIQSRLALHRVIDGAQGIAILCLSNELVDGGAVGHYGEVVDELMLRDAL